LARCSADASPRPAAADNAGNSRSSRARFNHLVAAPWDIRP
jgi:hypothetical protein